MIPIFVECHRGRRRRQLSNFLQYIISDKEKKVKGTVIKTVR